MSQKVLSGHRVKVSVFNVKTGTSQVVGIFNNATITYAYGAQAVFILGRTSAAALQFTHAEPVTFRLGAWRVDEHGPFVDGMVPELQDLLANDYITLTVLDREKEIENKDAKIGEIKSAIVTGFDESMNIRQLVEYTVSGMGIFYSDESSANAEGAAATDLP